ncbi:hypothetical protein AVEN_90651-1 [Araneus ventricosus]|uniref:Uncharacterized protein n=1 Tax=Araneus ventricosus TaxID=182803 RepID=A0A4Y2HJM4_ARAVE|nr:hypothetical protein AVEN_90651-1 [Araneus ventricosus]
MVAVMSNQEGTRTTKKRFKQSKEYFKMRLSTKLLFLFAIVLALIAHQETEAKSLKKLIKAGLLLGALGSKKLPKVLPIPLPIPIQ